MAEVKPLKLRVERSSSKRSIAVIDPFVEVLVRRPFLQSQEIYTYSLPDVASMAEVGALVSVPFSNQIVEGVILSRSAIPAVAGKIKQIHALISQHSVFTNEQIRLSRVLAERYASDSWSILSSVAPAFSKEGEKIFLARKFDAVGENIDGLRKATALLPSSLLRHLKSDPISRDLLILPSQSDGYSLLLAAARVRARKGKVVLVLPDMKDLQACARALDSDGVRYVVLNSQQKKSERYANYLAANSLVTGIVLTLRNGVLLHLEPNDSLFIFNEVERHHYEQRSPSWNSRDICLIRSVNHSIFFFSHSPSVELVRQVDERWLSLFTFPRKKLRTAKFLTESGDSIFPLIERGLRGGNVLISVARAGWINGFSCKSCKNIAVCSCGGRLYLPDASHVPTCIICSTRFLDWHCSWCNGVQIWSTSKGAVRKAAEFGRAFPKAQVVQSSGEEQLQEIPEKNTIVVATLGSEPLGRYAAILILDAENAYSQVDLRTQEEVRLQWFKMISQLEVGGVLYLSLPAQSSVAQGVLKSDPYDLASREANERYSAKLPPYYRTLLIEAPFSDLQAISTLLADNGMESTLIEGAQKADSRLLVKFDVSKGQLCASLISSIQRIRASKKQTYLGLKFDSYSIS